MSLTIDTNKVVLNGCDLLNRHQLSRSQERGLQRYIDENAHLLQYVDKPAPERFEKKQKGPSVYSNIRNRLSRGTTPESVDFERSQSTANSPGSNNPVDILFNRLQSSLSPNSETIGKRKEVKWSDARPLVSQRARSHSPIGKNAKLYEMSQYGSTGNLTGRGQENVYLRERTASPAYSTLDKHRDDYNRYDTARHLRSRKMERLRREEDERSRFSGYGSRPGSGVEFMPSKWQGGEVVPDRDHLPRSLKPRRFYYSPIGDGVVAADGVEIKRHKDMSPRVSVLHTRTIEKGDPGSDGYNLYEKIFTHGGSEYGSDYGGGSGRNSRTAGTLSPSNEPYGYSPGNVYSGSYPGNAGGGYGSSGYGSSGTPGPQGYRGRESTPPKTYVSAGPGVGHENEPFGSGYGGGAPATGDLGSGYDVSIPGGRSTPGTGVAYGSAPASNYGTYGSRDPYGTYSSARGDPFVTDGRGSAQIHNSLSGGPDGLTGYEAPGRSAGDYGFDSSKKYDIKTEYLITNPRELIHQYATTTPISVLNTPEATPATTSRTVKKFYSSTTEEKFAPYPPYKGPDTTVHPSNFARQLRDEGLTASQREANRRQDPVNAKDSNYEHKISEIRQQTYRSPAINEIDYLTEKMMYGLQTGHPTPPEL